MKLTRFLLVTTIFSLFESAQAMDDDSNKVENSKKNTCYEYPFPPEEFHKVQRRVQSGESIKVKKNTLKS